jgi:hypothetical protein
MLVDPNELVGSYVVVARGLARLPVVPVPAATSFQPIEVGAGPRLTLARCRRAAASRWWPAGATLDPDATCA